MIEYHNPEGAVGIEATPYTLSTSIRGPSEISVGFLANGFPDSENFLNALQQAMQDIAPGLVARSYNKGNASVPASEEMLADLQSQCQAVVAAYGH